MVAVAHRPRLRRRLPYALRRRLRPGPAL